MAVLWATGTLAGAAGDGNGEVHNVVAARKTATEVHHDTVFYRYRVRYRHTIGVCVKMARKGRADGTVHAK